MDRCWSYRSRSPAWNEAHDAAGQNARVFPYLSYPSPRVCSIPRLEKHHPSASWVTYSLERSVLEYGGYVYLEVGVFSALYAAYLRPDLRVTSSELSAIINGVATILMFMFIDPYLSMLTDEVAEGKVTEPYFVGRLFG
jgi:hypothetical protein